MRGVLQKIVPVKEKLLPHGFADENVVIPEKAWN